MIKTNILIPIFNAGLLSYNLRTFPPEFRAVRTIDCWSIPLQAGSSVFQRPDSVGSGRVLGPRRVPLVRQSLPEAGPPARARLRPRLNVDPQGSKVTFQRDKIRLFSFGKLKYQNSKENAVFKKKVWLVYIISLSISKDSLRFLHQVADHTLLESTAPESDDFFPQTWQYSDQYFIF